MERNLYGDIEGFLDEEIQNNEIVNPKPKK